MLPSIEFQARLQARKAEVSAAYPALWSRIIQEWKSPGPANRAWLLYSANYLFRTDGVRWALDPLTLDQRLPSAPAVNAAKDLKDLAFVLLTHRHKDHFDLGLIRALRRLPILWIVPPDLLEPVRGAGLSMRQIIVPRPMEKVEIEGLHITPFEGQHWEVDPGKPEGRRGVPSTGYLAEFTGRRWLFPGDIRTYDASQLPFCGDVDGVVLHLWLGRAAALLEKPPLLDAFCRFCRDLHAPRVVVTHLLEWGRQPSELWLDSHFELVRQQMQALSPHVSLTPALMGESVDL